MINTCVNLPRSAQCGFQGFGGDCILPAWRRGAASIKLKVPPKKSVSLRFKKSHAAVFFLSIAQKNLGAEPSAAGRFTLQPHNRNMGTLWESNIFRVAVENGQFEDEHYMLYLVKNVEKWWVSINKGRLVSLLEGKQKNHRNWV